MILFIDNYDSFVYNIFQYMGHLGAAMSVHRNDQVTVAELVALQPSGLVISPGPCSPKEAGVSLEAIRAFAGRIPILGICLGHQAIADLFGGVVRRAVRPMHGKTCTITHDGLGCFQGVRNPLVVCRYHSLSVDASTLPDCLQPTAFAPDGEIMGLRHKRWPIEGLQFHPESLFTEDGYRMLNNFLTLTKTYASAQTSLAAGV
jgi:anthranilate synthase/aminodeoxychorismate synthase-like glutamine amidotransferase